MAKAYRIPDTPGANVQPGAKGFATVPISRMIPRSWITSHGDGARVPAGKALPLRGIAMGGDTAVRTVELSSDGGRTWTQARLGHDEGKYSFRRFEATLRGPVAGELAIFARCTNMEGATQTSDAIWNSSGYLRGQIEPIRLVVT
jgi:hypothetical protein